MTDKADEAKSRGEGGASHRRRARYRGTHPTKFQERYKELSAEAYPEVIAHVRAQGRTPAGAHVPVLVKEVLARLSEEELAGALWELGDEPDAWRIAELIVAWRAARPLGRIGVISFHSGEDRLVKGAFAEGVAAGVYEAASGEVVRAVAEVMRAALRAFVAAPFAPGRPAAGFAG